MEANHILALVGAITLAGLGIVAFMSFVVIGVQIGMALGRRLGLSE